MNLLRRYAFNFFVAFIYVTIIQVSVGNSVYTLYIPGGDNATTVVKKHQTDDKPKLRWAINQHLQVNNAKYFSSPVCLGNTYIPPDTHEFVLLNLSDISLTYESVKYSILKGRSPPLA
ncbi:MAG: hypothetical protein ACM3S2_06085 [Ignavibacteriales bacterium]